MAEFLKPLSRVCQIIFALSLAYFALRLVSYHIALVTFPYSNTLREADMMSSTYALVNGLNPYDMSLQPQFMNQYGIVYPLLVWPWAKLFGTTILIHRAVTAFSILGSCTVIFLVLRKMSVPVLLNIWAVLMLYSSLLFPGTSTPCIDPGATGTFFFLLAVFIPWFYEYSYKSLTISLLFGILALYTKLYTFLAVPVILSYLFFFVSKRKGFFYGSLLLILLAISIITVNHIFPAYFNNCFFSSMNMSSAWLSTERLHLQIVLYGGLYQWTLILMGALLIWYGFKIIRDNSWASIKKSHFPLVLYAGLCSAFVLYASLGRNTGAMLWYFFQLLSPFLLIGAAWIFSRYAFWPVVCVPFLIFNLYTMTSDQNYKWFDKNTLGWPEVSLLVSQHQHILNSPLIAPMLIEQNKEFYDDGQTEYFLLGGQRNGVMKRLFKEDGRVLARMMVFFNTIRTEVQEKKFDLIMLQPSLLPLGVGDAIKKYYKYEGQLMVYVPQDRKPYAVTVWKPL